MTQSLALDLRGVGDQLDQATHVAIASHMRPDGDAVGSLIALGDALQQSGKKVTLLNQDPLPASFRFLPGLERVKRPVEVESPLPVDQVVVLDTSSRDRVGDAVWKCFPPDAAVLLIDHHITNTHYGTHHHVDEQAPATGEIIYQLIEEMGWPLTDLARQHLWVAINTDTGSFQYPSTTATTLQIAADLVRDGIDPGYMATMLYHTYPERRLHLLGRLLPTLDIRAGGRLASWRMKASDLNELQIQPGDTEGLIDHLRSIDGVIMAASFEEASDGTTIRVSTRSKDASIADVSLICSQYGGGGHQLAAGASLPGPLDHAAEDFLQTATQHIEDGIT